MDLIAAAYGQNPIIFLKERALKEAKRKKKILLCDSWEWKKEGADVFERFKSQFGVYRSIVVPREQFRHVMEAINFHAGQVLIGNASPRYSFLNPMIGSIVGEDRSRGRKAFLVRWRNRVLNQLRTHQEPVCAEHEALAVMQQSLGRSMLIPRSKCLILRMRRERYANGVAWRDKLSRLIEECNSIKTCRSLSHYKPEGCMKCPVIYIKGEPMIRAIDRSNNLPVVNTIEHEMKLLQSDYLKAVQFVAELHRDMEDVREVMKKKLVYDMQAWYLCRIANRQATRQHNRKLLSLYFYRVRKLVRMKGELDVLVYRRCSSEELNSFDTRYSDLSAEAEEYRRKLAMRNRYIELKYAPVVVAQFKKLYAIRKEREYREANEAEIQRRREKKQRQERKKRMMMKMDMDDSEEAVRNRLLAKMKLMAEKRFICPRVECRREFKSQQRLDIHMQQHVREQAQLAKVRAMHASNKKRREEEEKVFLGRLAALRTIKNSLIEYKSLDNHDNSNRFKFLDALTTSVALASFSDAGANDVLVVATPVEEEGHAEIEYYNAEEKSNGPQELSETGYQKLEEGFYQGGQVEVSTECHDPQVSQSAVEDDELDPFYEIESSTTTYRATGSFDMSKIDLLDEDLIAELDANLLKYSARSADNDSASHQYSMADVVPSTDYYDIFTSKSSDLSFIDSKDPDADFLETGDESVIGASCADEVLDDALVCRKKLETDDENCSSLQISNSKLVEETPRPSGLALLKYKFRSHSADTSKAETNIESDNPLVPVPSSTNSMSMTFTERYAKNHIQIPDSKSLTELVPSPMDSVSFRNIQSKFIWMKQQQHMSLIFDNMRAPMKHLELLSKHPDVECPYRIPLIPPVVRMGTMDSCDVVFVQKGLIKKEGRVSKLHVVIYVPLHTEFKDNSISVVKNKIQKSGTRNFSSSFQSGSRLQVKHDGEHEISTSSVDEDPNAVTIVDNHTIWGTYLVSAAGVRKVPTITTGYTQTLNSGDLLCIGVRWRGPETLSALEASNAVMVYRVRCTEDTSVDNL